MISEPEFFSALEESWPQIERTAARSLKAAAQGFLPETPKARRCMLGMGSYGCVWQTADPRFVLKASFDATEGPIVSTLVKKFRFHPGLVYFHGIWRLPDLVWTNEFGYTPIWIFLREEVNVGVNTVKVRGMRADMSHAADIATSFCAALASGESKDVMAECRREFLEAVKLFDEPPGKKVAQLIRDALKKGIVLGDTHGGNVGLRCHDLSKFGVQKHRQFVVTDVGDPGQAPLTVDRHPKIKSIGKNCPPCFL